MAATDSYTLLPVSDRHTAAVSPRRTCRGLLGAISLAAVLLSLAALLTTRPDDSITHPPPPTKMVPFSRGPAEGVSEKSTTGLLAGPDYQWTDEMLNWQRPSFHFKPRKNWMNDPDGPMLYNGWYHLFYQYNPYSAVWGNITWGHAVSLDLINWLDLPLALVPDSAYDVNGVWTGSATLLPDGRVMMPYTGSTADSVQVQNLAYPADPVGDPLLIHWRKSDANPVLVPPPGILPKDFRDPSTGWRVPTDESWRIAIGSKNDSAGAGHAGICLVYKTDDFVHYELLPTLLHSVAGTGMWECIDFYPVSTTEAVGLDTAAVAAGPAVRHVLKASLDDDKHDYYAIGRYDAERGVWEAEEAERDVGIGLRYDYGKYYASKTFYDPARERQVLWGWSGETDSERADILKGWSGLQTIPRTVLFDQKTKRNLLLWPVDEVERLRDSHQHFNNIEIGIGSVVPLELVGIGSANTAFDIVAEFEIESRALTDTIEADIGYNCSTSSGAAGRGALGPFGLLVSADQDLSEQLAVYFYVGRKIDGELDTFFCHDEIRSSIADDIVKRVYGNIVPVLDGEILTVRVLVDHSIVESFAQGGRTCITSRVYPTKAIYDNSKIFLFNNATEAKVRAKSVTIWQMRSAKI